MRYITGLWFGTSLFFPFGNVIIPTDFHIFQRGRSTTNQIRFLPRKVHDISIVFLASQNVSQDIPRSLRIRYCFCACEGRFVICV